MKQTYDTDSVLFGLLKGANSITSSITGGVYVGQRPANSEKEDIVINTIALTQDSTPQIGTSVINIHVSDVLKNIGGVQQKVENRDRLKTISDLVLTTIRSSKVLGLKLSVDSQATIQEPDLFQHYVNIRVNWNIHE
jgi:hypothetical protein